MAFNVGCVLFEYFMLRHICRREGLTTDKGPGGFWPFVGLGMLTGLAILAGSLLLVVPGLYLAARWAPTGGLLVGAGRGVTEAMGEGWRMTANCAWPIVGAIAVACLPGVAAFALAIVFGDDEGNPTSPIVSFVMNGGLFASVFLTWYVGIAVYSLLVDKAPELYEVFA